MNPAPILPIVDHASGHTFVVHLGLEGYAMFIEVDENGYFWRRTFRRNGC